MLTCVNCFTDYLERYAGLCEMGRISPTYVPKHVLISFMQLFIVLVLQYFPVLSISVVLLLLTLPASLEHLRWVVLTTPDLYVQV